MSESSANGTGALPSVLSGQIPYSQEAEEAVIGAVLVNPEAFLMVASFLTADDFYILRHAYIWEALDRISQRSEPIDYLTTQEELRAQGRLTEIGGPAYLTQLLNSMPTSMHAEIYGRIVERAAIRRRLMAAAVAIHELAMDEELPTDKVEAESQAVLMRTQRSATSGALVPIRVAVREHFEQTEEAMKNPRDLLGLPSSLSALNEYLKGYRNKKLYIAAGRPGMGKSSFLYTEAAFLAAQRLPVAFFTIEVGIEEMTDFMIAGESGVSPDQVKTGRLNAGEWQRYVKATGKVSEWPLFIDDAGDLRPSQIRLRCMRLAHEHGLAAVFIDYLQLVSGGGEVKYGNRDQELGYISRSLKQLSKELDVPVIAAAQLSREVEKRQDKHPTLSDLRESGNIENDADVVMLFYRDDYYNKPSVPVEVSRVEVGIAKHRGGRTGVPEVGFRASVKKFVNYRSE